MILTGSVKSEGHRIPVNPSEIFTTDAKDKGITHLNLTLHNEENFVKKCQVVYSIAYTSGSSYGEELLFTEEKEIQTKGKADFSDKVYASDSPRASLLKDLSRAYIYCIGYEDGTDKDSIPSVEKVVSIDTDSISCQASQSDQNVCASKVLDWSESRFEFIEEVSIKK